MTTRPKASRSTKPPASKVAVAAVSAVRKRKPAAAPPAPVPAPISAAARQTKQASLISLLRREAGATMDEMIRLTGWLPHTVRGTISGSLRKKLGLQVVCGAEDGKRRYRITA